MNFLDESTNLEKVSMPKSKANFTEYELSLKELATMEANAEYSSSIAPNLPLGGNSLEVEGRKLFTGLGKKIGAGMFCFGRKDSGSEKYKYLTQNDFDKMVEKSKEAIQNIPT